MKKLIEKLHYEAGLTRDQARMIVGIFGDYLVENNEDPDLAEMLRVRTNRMGSGVKSKHNDWVDHVIKNQYY